MSRYQNTRTVINNVRFYRSIIKDRGIEALQHYKTHQFYELKEEDLKDLVINYKVWSLGDRLHKFAHEAYGDSELWWVLAWFNQKPTDAHFKIGEKIAIPHPLETLMTLYYKPRT